MAKENETIADIIAEKRQYANYIVQVAQGKCQTRRDKAEDEARDMRREADRLDAAHKRETEAVGDAKKLGAALLEIRDAMRVYMSVGGISARRTIEMAFEIARDALAAPPRNCDKYPTFNDAIRALADKRGWHDAKWDSERYCILASWLYAPATEKEGCVE